jgi:hypothetical protein
VAGGFDNVTGITLDGRHGMVYAAETSAQRVQQLDSKGRAVRQWKLACHPQYMALDGDWLDTSCDSGLVSINVQTDHLQTVHQGSGDPALSAPSGVVYGSDGLLYVVDGSALVAYKVQH